MAPQTCPECGASLVGKSPTKHIIAEYHLTPGSTEELVAQVARRENPVQLERIKAILGVAGEGA